MDIRNINPELGDNVIFESVEEMEQALIILHEKDDEDEPSFTCEDCGDSFSDDGSCLTIVNERRDEIKHYCQYCTEHGRFELNPGDKLVYDPKRWRKVRQGNNLVYLERV